MDVRKVRKENIYNLPIQWLGSTKRFTGVKGKEQEKNKKDRKRRRNKQKEEKYAMLSVLMRCC